MMAEGDRGRQRDVWDKLGVVSGFVAAVFVPLALGLAGHWYAAAISLRETQIKERESDLKEQEFARQWVQISLDILRDEGTVGPEGLRRWAVKVINYYTHPDINMDEDLSEALATGRSSLPASGAGDRVQRVEAMQTAALQALLERDIDGAIEQMGAAHREWHDFRTVWETLRLLRERRDELTPDADAAWSTLYRDLVREMDMRGVPETVRERLRSGG
jgi:hypothetical protein